MIDPPLHNNCRIAFTRTHWASTGHTRPLELAKRPLSWKNQDVRLAVHWYPLSLNGIYMDLLNAEGACELFQQIIWCALSSNEEKHSRTCGPKAARLKCITMFQVYRCLPLLQPPPQSFAFTKAWKA